MEFIFFLYFHCWCCCRNRHKLQRPENIANISAEVLKCISLRKFYYFLFAALCLLWTGATAAVPASQQFIIILLFNRIKSRKAIPFPHFLLWSIKLYAIADCFVKKCTFHYKMDVKLFLRRAKWPMAMAARPLCRRQQIQNYYRFKQICSASICTAAKICSC